MRSLVREYWQTDRRRAAMVLLAPAGLALALTVVAIENPSGLLAAWQNAVSRLGQQRTAATDFAPISPNLLALLDERSPGARDPNALSSVKPERLADVARSPNPRERVLSQVRERPGPGVTGLGPTLADAAAPLSLVLPETAAQAVPPGLAEIGPSGGGGTNLIPAGGPPGLIAGIVPGSPGAVPETQPTTTPIPSAIPEPATWATMIVGLFTLAALRRRRGWPTRRFAPLG